MNTYFDLSRRRFLRTAAVSGAAVLAMPLLGRFTGSNAAIAVEAAKASDATLFVALQDDGSVTITCHRSEMGQHARTAIKQIICDEMEADWNRATIEQALGDKRYGDQNTDGSRSIRFNFERLRVVGASFRHMLREAAAEAWNVSVDECLVANHEVVHTPSDRRLGFGDLAQRVGAMQAPEPDVVPLKKRQDWKHIGKGDAIIDMQAILTGKANYGADTRLPDTVVAMIQRPPVVLAKVQSYDAAEARKVAGVIDIIEMPALTENPVLFKPLGGIAVLATNTWAAKQGLDKLSITWGDSPNSEYDSRAFKSTLAEANTRPGDVHRSKGDVDTALSQADKTLLAEYYVPHLAQAPMEPPAATARWKDEVMEVWSCTQNPQTDQELIAGLLGLDESQVKVHVTLLGGAFGRKSKPDFAAEAAWLAHKTGRTVRVQWNREDDIRHGFYHTVSSQRLEGALDSKGKLQALRHRSTFPTISATFAAGAEVPDFETDLGLSDGPFDLEHMQSETGRVTAQVRTGWMRSVANIYHVFAQQSFMAELAHAAGRDHREFLLEAIGPDRIIDFEAEGSKFSNYGADFDRYPFDTARLKNVLRLASDKAGWGRKMPAGSGLGLAVHRSFLTYVATVVEVSVNDKGEIHIPKVWVAVDAGTVVNTDSVRNQMEGASVFGLSLALYSQITLAEGRVQQGNFNDYQVARITDAPDAIDVQIVESDAVPAGVGEPGTPPFAPALCNALFAATGTRIRELPIGNQLKQAV
ncbi:MAG: molybdopterin-dependent oxidoreductase [Congregibacter sp.]